MDDRVQHVLDVVTAQLTDEFGDKLLGVLLTGSHAYGEPMATSDVDVHVVIDEPWRQRRNLVVDGIPVELLISPPHKLSNEIIHGDATTDMFARGRPVLDPKGVVRRLVDEAKAVAAMPRPIPLGDDLEWLRYVATDALTDAYDLLDADDEGFDYALFHALDCTLDAYHQLSGRRRPKTKRVIRDIREREPALADAVARIMDTSVPRRDRYDTLDALLDEVLANVGGRLVTSETKRERVDPEPVIAHIEGRELPSEDIVVPAERPRPSAVSIVVFAVLGLGLFVVALGLMKSGAAAIAPALRGSIFTDNPWSTLGFGWLGACIVLSGSPVAASALTLFDGGSITRAESFTMLTGSRLGAAFVVLVAGTIYAVRNRAGSGRRAPISIGILSLLVTACVYVPASTVGYLLLERGAFDGLTIGTSPSVASATDLAFGWAVDLAKSVLPGWMLFPLGVVVLLVAFALIDRVMPSVGLDRTEDRPEAWYDRKWPMFALGCGVCLLTLSVSVALTVLVPLVAKGYLRRANVLPYVMGANITTLVDTLVAAVLLGNLDAVRVVAAATVSVAVLSLFVLAFLYPLFRRFCLGVAQRALVSRVRLAGFVAVLFAVPVILIAV